MAESIQRRLTRERPPRVKITYDVETGGAIVKTELPFVMGVIADLSGDREGVTRTRKAVPGKEEADWPEIVWQDYRDRAFVEIDRDNFNDVLAEFAPRLKYKPGEEFKAALGAWGFAEPACDTEIAFHHLNDFLPDRIVERVEPMKGALALRNLIRDVYTKMDMDDKLLCACHADVMDLPEKPGDIESETARAMGAERSAAVSGYFANRKAALQAAMEGSSNPRALIRALIAEVAELDALLAGEMDRLLHEKKEDGKDFPTLEAAWRGLFSLVRNTATGTGLKLKVLNASEDELYKDLTEAIDFDQSHLFKMIYEETYGTQGGYPYSCLLHDYYYGRDARSMALAGKMTEVAAAAHAPLLTAAAPGLLDLESFKDLSAPRDLSKIFESAEHIAWRSLREREDSRYLTMCLPRILMRAPYAGADVESFAYEEKLAGVPTYALGARITAAFALYGWTAAIRGMEGGGLVEDLPLHNYVRASGDVVTKIPTETAITDRREKELSDLGFISLCYRLGTDKAVFFGGQTVNKPLKYLEDDATANANLSARLPYMLNASRFAHYVKSIMRDKIGSFLDRESVSKFLNKWLSAYVLLSDDAPQSLKASYPLREARVDVVEDEANPGSYRAVMYLRPHFQMEELAVSIRLVAKLPAPAA